MGSLFSRSTPDPIQIIAPAPAPQLPVQTPQLPPLPPVMPSPPPPPAPVLAPLPPPAPPALPRLPQTSITDRINDLQRYQQPYSPPTTSAPSSNAGSGGNSSNGNGGNNNSNPPPVSEPAADPDTVEITGLLDRRRSRFGTVLTGWTGVLTPNELVPIRRTLLGE
jgi:hypothetical protein